ncbi:GDSL-like Lipase/Acylhydrolase family protein [Asanoa hainanensis]|uniref:GDSL-like Lipase/Acylhydrolase family protein n=1 Tax=Asanoa hainanensis TaxID=560556 RepID=A0A239PD90_9ACTN|nr:GDSL-type esterase/lipase family protein [Asanoa hainanensis]SNT64574.1 GDSL-like Lipase/Acylhydrolase family protein [Asanoa hainanensis]
MDAVDGSALRRLLVFAAALAAFLALAGSGSSTLTIQVLFTIFVIAATIWVRGQYLDSLDDRQWLVSWRVGLALALVGAAMVVSYAFWPMRGVALAGAIVAYFVAGSAITWLRQGMRSDRRRLTLGVTFTGAGVVLAIAGLALLGRSSGRAVYAELAFLGLAFFALLPVGVALLSEVVIRRLCGSGRKLRLGTGLSGLALLLVSAALLFAYTRSPWLLGAIVVAGLMMVALVSTTQADVAFVLGVIALLGVTPTPEDLPPALRTDRTASSLLVAIGDSYMSGEGASRYYAGTDVGGDNQCRRSPSAWAAMAGQQPPFGRLEFLACSGARTWNVQSAARPVRPEAPVPSAPDGEEATQLDLHTRNYADAAFAPAMVVVSLGGNDAGFSTIGLMCLAPGNCGDQAHLWTDSLPQVKLALRDTYQHISDVFPRTPVVVVPYPDPIHLTGTCDDVALSIGERRFLHDYVTNGLNRVLRETAREFGFYYLAEMESALATAHLQLCDELNGGRPGLHFIGVRSVAGVAEQRFNPKNWSHSSLHPNERGHAAMLRTFQTWLPALDTMLIRTTAVGRYDSGRAAPAAVQAVPQCDLLDTTTAGCRTQGMRWAKSQVRTTAWTYGWLLLFPLAGTWAAAVAFFAWQRRRLATEAAANRTKAD